MRARLALLCDMRLAALALLTCLLTACDRDGRVVHAVLPTAQDVKEGATVRYRGIAVGQVNAVRIVDSGVQLDLSIYRADAPLRTADRVRVVREGIMGDQAVDVVPGPLSAPKLGSSGWLAAVPPDSLAAIREALSKAYAKEALDRFGALLSTAHPRVLADSVHSPAGRSPR